MLCGFIIPGRICWRRKMFRRSLMFTSKVSEKATDRWTPWIEDLRKAAFKREIYCLLRVCAHQLWITSSSLCCCLTTPVCRWRTKESFLRQPDDAIEFRFSPNNRTSHVTNVMISHELLIYDTSEKVKISLFFRQNEKTQGRIFQQILCCFLIFIRHLRDVI